MGTAQWIKKLGGHAGELYVAAELSKRGIPNALLPENFSDDDVIAGKKGGSLICYIQVKACHPDRGHSFPLNESQDDWVNAESNEFVIFVWLGSPKNNEGPRYWIATKKQVGQACIEIKNSGRQLKRNKERRFRVPCENEEGVYYLKKKWENNWKLFADLMPSAK
jgi:hypothetical protein